MVLEGVIVCDDVICLCRFFFCVWFFPSNYIHEDAVSVTSMMVTGVKVQGKESNMQNLVIKAKSRECAQNDMYSKVSIKD